MMGLRQSCPLGGVVERLEIDVHFLVLVSDVECSESRAVGVDDRETGFGVQIRECHISHQLNCADLLPSCN